CRLAFSSATAARITTPTALRRQPRRIVKQRVHDVVMCSPKVATQGGAANSPSTCVAAKHDGQVMPNAVRRSGVKMMRNTPLQAGQRKLATAPALPDIA